MPLGTILRTVQCLDVFGMSSSISTSFVLMKKLINVSGLFIETI